MATRKIQEERVQNLNSKSVRDGEYVLYWMQSSQRAEYNHTLECAVQRANEVGQREQYVRKVEKRIEASG